MLNHPWRGEDSKKSKIGTAKQAGETGVSAADVLDVAASEVL